MQQSPPSDRLASSPASDAARLAMTDESVLALLRQHFTGADSVYLRPSIPGKKELAARAVHGHHLPSGERVLALFDDTVFGSGEDGFLITAQRLCWKNVRGRAQMIEWQHLDADRMYAERRRLVLGTFAIEVSGDESITSACEAVFHVLAFSARVPATSAARSGVVLSGNTVVAGSEGGGQARDAHEARDPHEPSDRATRASARPTLRPSARPSARPPTPPRPSRPAPVTSEIAPRSDPEPAIANATPPPPNAVTYASYVVHASSQRGPTFACWHCHTPLYWDTPQCARCSAWPAPRGWQRTG